MAGIKITDLPAVPSAQLTDVFPVDQGATTYKETNAQLLSLFESNIVITPSNFSGTLPVGNGGTGNTTFTPYSLICAGTTATGAFQNVSGLGTTGQQLTSNGAGALPTWQAGSNPGGSNTQIQYNNAGSFGGDSGFTTNGAGTISLVGQLTVDNLRINGNTLSSEDANGNINITPNGTGVTSFSSDLKVVTNKGFIDSSGNEILLFGETAAAVNHLKITNNVTGLGPIFEALGDDANVGINFKGKGASVGAYFFSATTGTSSAIQIQEDLTNGTNAIGLKAPSSIAANYNFTFPDAVPTVSSSVLIATTSAATSWTNWEESVSFTPVPYGSTTAGSPTGTFEGKYSRYGRLVMGTIRLIFTSLDTMAGGFRISALPYTTSAAGTGLSGGFTTFRTNFTNDFVLSHQIPNNSSEIRVQNATADNTNVLITDLSATTNLYITFIYIAA